MTATLCGYKQRGELANVCQKGDDEVPRCCRLNENHARATRSRNSKNAPEKRGSIKRLAPPKLELGDWPQPKPGQGEVLVRVRAYGLCGLRRNFYKTEGNGNMLYPGLTKFPTVIGYEFAG